MRPSILFVDLFCGAGGSTSGIEHAKVFDQKVGKVVACVNHDANAIVSHAANHPHCLHFTEDIRTLDLTELVAHVEAEKSICPDAKIAMWGSLECTNFSKAKGGLPRDADSRTLAEHLFRYMDVVNYDYIFIENVEEFMAWGPLDENGKPLSKQRGQDYVKWINKMQTYGYKYDWRLLNAADFGAYTSRKRYFGVFVKHGLPIKFPIPTHSKKALDGMQRWKPVKDVLDFSDEGESIFTRKKALSERTLERIYAGLLKYIAKGDKSFLQKYYSGRPKGKVNSTDAPAPTLTTAGGVTLVQPSFLLKYNSTNGKTGKHIPPSIDEPCPTVAAQPRLGLVNASFLAYYFPQWGMNCSHSIESPSPVLPARMDKMYPYLIQADETGMPIAIALFDEDSEATKKIKVFMAAYGIIDIKMRMLRIKELKLITGFDENYILKGTQQEQKKYIGNAVPVLLAKAIIESFASALLEPNLQRKVASSKESSIFKGK